MAAKIALLVLFLTLMAYYGLLVAVAALAVLWLGWKVLVVVFGC